MSISTASTRSAPGTQTDAERTGDPDGLRAYCDPMGVGWNYGPIYYFPRESIEQVVGQLCEDGDDFPVLFDGGA